MRALFIASCFLLFLTRLGFSQAIEPFAELSHGAAGISFTPSGEMLVSLHQYYSPKDRVLKITKRGEITTYPNQSVASRAENQAPNPLSLDSVQGLSLGKDGISWMLDNGRRSESCPKILGWNDEKNRLEKIIYLPSPITLASSYLANIAVDPAQPYLYISDPAQNAQAAIIVVNLNSGESRRLLQGHFSLLADESIPLEVNSLAISAQALDGSSINPQSAINGITTDRKGQWLYFGPMMGRTLYRIRCEHLRDKSLSAVELSSRVEGYSEKPVCMGITIDNKNNIYLGNLANSSIGVIEAKGRKYRNYITDNRLQWISGFCFGSDGLLYGYSNQLHLSPVYNSGKNISSPPFLIFRCKAITSGMSGR